MSIALDEQSQELLRQAANKKNISVSSLVRETLEKYVFCDADNIKIVMQIPKETAGDREKLEAWLNIKSQALMKHFGS